MVVLKLVFLSIILFIDPITDDIPSGKRIKTASVIAGVATPFQAADISDVKRSSNCFSDKEICVLNGSSSFTKQELERSVVSGGGVVVQHPSDFFLYFFFFAVDFFYTKYFS